MSAFLVAGALISILALAMFGEFTWTHLALSVKLLPALVLGFWLSGPIKRFTDRGWMRPAMLVLCAAASAMLFVRGLS